ncbi:MAG: hypothetical protein Q4F53_05050, partial [Nesterenkonia sp.]|nr:hypothetical protein [Nesterenkonia sp.]
LTCTAQSSPMLSPGDRATITLVSDSPSAQVTFSDGSASKTTIHRVQASLAEAGNGAHTLTLEVPDHVAQTVDDGVQVLVSDGERTSTCHASFTLLSGGTDPQAADVAADQRPEDEDDQVDADDEDGTDEADDGESERTPQPTERDDEGEDDTDEPADDETSASPASAAEESPSESVEAEGAAPAEEIAETGASNLVIGSAVMVVLLLGAGALVMARRHRMQ